MVSVLTSSGANIFGQHMPVSPVYTNDGYQHTTDVLTLVLPDRVMMIAHILQLCAYHSHLVAGVMVVLLEGRCTLPANWQKTLAVLLLLFSLHHMLA